MTPWEEIKTYLHLVAKNEEQDRRFQAQLQGVELPQTVFDPDELPRELTAGQMQQRQMAMMKAKALQERMRNERRGG